MKKEPYDFFQISDYDDDDEFLNGPIVVSEWDLRSLASTETSFGGVLRRREREQRSRRRKIISLISGAAALLLLSFWVGVPALKSSRSGAAGYLVNKAPDGTVGLGAGREILLKPEGEKHVFIMRKSAGDVGGTGVDNEGSINAAAAELKANGGNVYALAIIDSGEIKVTGAMSKGGSIYLMGGEGKVENSGSVVIGNANGSITISGNEVELSSRSEITSGGAVEIVGASIASEAVVCGNLGNGCFIPRDGGAITISDPTASGNTGRVILSNPHGMAVGAGDAASFVVSTLNVSDDCFMNDDGQLLFSAESSNSIINLGNVNLFARYGHNHATSTDAAAPEPIANAGTVYLGGDVSVASLTTNVGGTTTIGGDVTTSGDQTFGDSVTLPNFDVGLKAIGGNVYALAINSPIRATSIDHSSGRISTGDRSHLLVENFGVISRARNSKPNNIRLKSDVRNSGAMPIGSNSIGAVGSSGALNNLAVFEEAVARVGGLSNKSNDDDSLLFPGEEIDLDVCVANSGSQNIEAPSGPGDRAHPMTFGAEDHIFLGSSLGFLILLIVVAYGGWVYRRHVRTTRMLNWLTEYEFQRGSS